MKRQQWTVRRRTVGHAAAQRRWDRAYQLLLQTLRKHFRDELERGSIEATAKVGQSLFRMATEGNSVAAAIFWMKARTGWREKHDPTPNSLPEMTDPDGARQRIARRIDALAPRLPDDPVEASRVYQRLIQGRAE
jgi:hypothetical protein